MNSNQRGILVTYLSDSELDQAIAVAQRVDETRLVLRLCYVKNLYAGDTRKEAGRRVVDRAIHDALLGPRVEQWLC